MPDKPVTGQATSDAPTSDRAPRSRRAEVLNAIEGYVRRHDRPPTVREIAREAGIPSLAHVAYLLTALERRGDITRDRGVSRGIHLTHPLEHSIDAVPGVPIWGTIAAGAPLDLFDHAECETLDLGLPTSTNGGGMHAGQSVYALRVRGDSMIEDGILDGDYVLVRQGFTASEGAIVVAVRLGGDSGGERGAATLKRLHFQRDRRSGRVHRVLLCPANAAMRPIEVPADVWDREWEVQGTVIAVYRPYSQPRPRRGSFHPRARRGAGSS